MWVGQQRAGGASFLSFCQPNSVMFKNQACDQQPTKNVKRLRASQLAISASYQLSYAGAAFCPTG